MSVGFAVSWVRRFVFNLVPCSSSEACGFTQHVLPQVTLRGLHNLSGSSWLSCSCGGAMYVGFAVSLVIRLVFNLVPCSSSVACGFAQLTLPQVALRGFCLFWHLTWCCAGGVGWAATLPLCCQCFSCTGWLAGVRWVLHPVSGSSHRGCDCSWVAVWCCLSALLASRALLVVLSSPPAVLDLCGGCALFSACSPLP